MSSEFVKFQEYSKRLRTIYFNALCAFYAYEAIEELITPNIVGKKEAEANVVILNRFKNFLVIARNTLNFYFLMELAKILDDARQSLHLTKLINFANSNKKKLSVNEFKNLNPDRAFLQDLANRYEGMEKEDFEKIEKRLEETKNIREKIKECRDQNLAHEDLKKKKVSISQTEIIKIFDLIAEILNIFSNKTDFSTTNYTHIEGECKRDTKNVFEYLRRFEPYRLKEIEKEHIELKLQNRQRANEIGTASNIPPKKRPAQARARRKGGVGGNSVSPEPKRIRRKNRARAK